MENSAPIPRLSYGTAVPIYISVEFHDFTIG